MYRLLTCTCLTPVFLIATTASAETIINTARTTPIRTANANNGAADSVTIDAAGSVKITAGTAVTMDSNHAVSNKGAIQITGANGATGILALANTSGAIANSGTITIDETYTPTDTDKDGDIDGPFAQGNDRYGIRVGAGHSGAVSNSGTITIEGNQSYGIALDGPLVGNLTNTGKIEVLGDNGFGVRAGAVNGNVVLEGAIGVKGANSVAAALTGDVTGSVRVQGALVSTGYRSTTRPADVSKLDADDLLQGGSALQISGNVTGGIILDGPPADKDPKDEDEDKDGVKDAQEGTASVTTYGSAAAVKIGASDRAITVGPVVGNASGHGLIINGNVSGQGVYKGVDANGLTIGGMGQAVTIAGGITVNGKVEAISLDQNATAIRIGNQAVVNEIVVNGTVGAAGGGIDGTRVTAIQLDAGSSTTKLTNTGTIVAKVNSDKAIGAAIVDRAGTLTSITNQGRIVVDGAIGTDRAIAMDLSANTTGVTVKQSRLAPASAAPEIAGNILFGSGADTLDASSGKIVGKVQFGAGNDRFLLSGDASYAGAVSFGTGNNQLSLGDAASFTGSADFGNAAGQITVSGTARLVAALNGTSATSLTINGGSVLATNTGPILLSSLNVAAPGSIGITINSANGTNTMFDVAGTAQFAAGSKLFVTLDSVQKSEGTYTFLRAGSLVGAPTFQGEGVALPYLFKGVVNTDAAAKTATVTITRKSATELNLNKSEASAFDAITKAVDSDARVASSILSIGNEAGLREAFQDMLPDHAGGVFDSVTLASRSVARYIADPNSKVVDMGGWGLWIQQNFWKSTKSRGATAAYDVSGWGITGGAEMTTGVGQFGASVGYMFGKNDRNQNEATSGQIEGALYWRGQWGGLYTFARGSLAHLDLEGSRQFTGRDQLGVVERTSRGKWKGQLVSLAGGVSYAIDMDRLTLRPAVSVDYYRVTENAYQETGGGTAIDLFVDRRVSEETAANATLALSYDLAPQSEDLGQPRLEVEGGRRQILSSRLGSTIARFKDGKAFTLTPDSRTDGWIGALRVTGGSEGFRLGAEVNAEEQQKHVAWGFRASLTAEF